MRVLFIGASFTSHLMVLANAIKAIDSSIILDWFTCDEHREKYGYEFPFPMDNCYQLQKHFSPFLYRIPGVAQLFRRIDFYLSAKQFQHNKYDIAQFHFIEPSFNRLLNQVKKISKVTIATPWGSDVNLATSKWPLIKFFSKIDRVTAVNEILQNTLINEYRIPSNKISILWVTGTQALEDIFTHPELTKQEAKHNLGFCDDFIILVGTNASYTQRHALIIDQLSKIKEYLPANYKVVALLGRNSDYDKEVIEHLDNSGLRYHVFKSRLSREVMLNLRKATDLLIHAQPADVDSCSLKEALLCDTMIVNGSWLKYPNTEKWGMPYYIFDSFDELPTVILRAVENSDNIHKTEELDEYLHSLSMKSIVTKVIQFYKDSIQLS